MNTQPKLYLTSKFEYYSENAVMVIESMYTIVSFIISIVFLLLFLKGFAFII